MAKTVSLILTTHKKRKSGTKKTKRKRTPRSINAVHKLSRHSYKRGSFKRYCARKGYAGANNECIAAALASGNLRRKRQAVLVRTLNRIRPK